MAKVHIAEIAAHLDGDMRNALYDAVLEVLPSVTVDPDDLYRAFKRQLNRRFSTWATVPEHFIRE